MGWITSLLGGLGDLAGAIGKWWSGRQDAAHDAQVGTQQQTKDALVGEDNAIQQVDRVNAATDAGGVPVSADPNNRNR